MDYHYWLNVLKEWQTLVSAGLALLAAGATIYYMRKQMRQEAERHCRATERRRMAIRAQLPNALSSMHQYVHQMTNWLFIFSNEQEPPLAALATLQGAIEFVDDNAANRLFELVSWYQVWSSRIGSFDHKANNTMDQEMYDCALMMAYVNSLFEYARNEEDEVSDTAPTRSDMESGLKQAIGLVGYVKQKEKLGGVFEIIDRNHFD